MSKPMLGSYWKKRPHHVICLYCNWRRYRLTEARAWKLTWRHSRRYPHHIVATSMHGTSSGFRRVTERQKIGG